MQRFLVFISYFILGCVFVVHNVEFDLSFSVEELPVQMALPRMTPTSKGDNMILTYESHFIKKYQPSLNESKL